jgi:hypothetical protein
MGGSREKGGRNTRKREKRRGLKEKEEGVEVASK